MSGRGVISSVDDAAARLAAARASGLRVVLCHGCFDIVHPGHVRHLAEAARYGDRLIVSVSGDAAVGKGHGRPLIPEELRAENLAALDCVDWVVVNQDPTAERLLERLRPDVYVKGREYEHAADPRCRAEVEVVRGYGGRVIFSSGDVVFSSSALIAAMEERAAPSLGLMRRLLEQHDLRDATVEPVLERMRGRRVVVVGETQRETYVLCDRPLGPGAGGDDDAMMTLRPVERRAGDGGAALLARQLAALGAETLLVTALPDVGASDDEDDRLRVRLARDGIELRPLPSTGGPVRIERYMVGSSRVMNLESGQPFVLDAAQQRRLVDEVVDAARDADALIVSDLGRGLLTPGVLGELCTRARSVCPLLIGYAGGRRSRPAAFRDLDAAVLSERTLRETLHNLDDGLTSVVWSMLGRARCRAAVVTVADDGLIAFESRADAHTDDDQWRSRLSAVHVPRLADHAVDPVGVELTLVAVVTLGLAGGGTMATAALLGAVAGTTQAQRLGPAVVAAADLRRGLRRLWDAQLAIAAPGPVAVRSEAVASLDQLRPAHA